jgi:hypothetical protein
MQQFLAVLMSFFHYSPLYTFPATLLNQLFFHPPSPHFAIYFLVNLLVLLIPNSYTTLFGNSISFQSLYMYKPTQFYFLPFPVHPQTNTILFPSTLCTSPNQHNLCNLIVSVMVGFLPIVQISLSVNILNFLFHRHIMGLEFFYTLSFKRGSRWHSC